MSYTETTTVAVVCDRCNKPIDISQKWTVVEVFLNIGHASRTEYHEYENPTAILDICRECLSKVFPLIKDEP